MTIKVTREAVCLADDQLEPLELTVEFGAEATLENLTGRLAKSGFLHFSSTCHTLLGRSRQTPLFKIRSRWGSLAVEYLLAADTRLAVAVPDTAIDFRFERDPPLRPMQADLDRRRPAWLALSDLFLDTDVNLFRESNTRLLADSPYTLDELDAILREEVYPACSANLTLVAERAGGLRRRLAGTAHPARRPAAPALVAAVGTLPDAGLEHTRAAARRMAALAGGRGAAQTAVPRRLRSRSDRVNRFPGVAVSCRHEAVVFQDGPARLPCFELVRPVVVKAAARRRRRSWHRILERRGLLERRSQVRDELGGSILLRGAQADVFGPLRGQHEAPGIAEELSVLVGLLALDELGGDHLPGQRRAARRPPQEEQRPGRARGSSARPCVAPCPWHPGKCHPPRRAARGCRANRTRPRTPLPGPTRP